MSKPFSSQVILASSLTLIMNICLLLHRAAVQKDDWLIFYSAVVKQITEFNVLQNSLIDFYSASFLCHISSLHVSGIVSWVTLIPTEGSSLPVTETS